MAKWRVFQQSAKASNLRFASGPRSRVRSVVDEAIELVAANTQGPVEIRVGSDSFDLKVTLNYRGNLPALPDARPKREMVSGLHADRIERSARGEACEIELLFRL